MNRPPPSVEEQRALLQRTFDYLQNTIPKLPDFYAIRNTVRYEEPPERDSNSWKIPHQDQTLHFANSEHATVHYRNGEELVEKDAKIVERRVAAAGARTFEINGTFGPILSFVLTAATNSSSAPIWKRWEHRKDGDLAVFSYRITESDISPELVYCCLPEGDGTTLYQNKADSYGEFAVKPDTGAIMRIVINADLDEERHPDVPLIRSQIMVEYGPVELGGKSYVCPRRSVEISRGRTRRELHEWGMAYHSEATGFLCEACHDFVRGEPDPKK